MSASKDVKSDDGSGDWFKVRDALFCSSPQNDGARAQRRRPSSNISMPPPSPTSCTRSWRRRCIIKRRCRNSISISISCRCTNTSTRAGEDAVRGSRPVLVGRVHRCVAAREVHGSDVQAGVERARVAVARQRARDDGHLPAVGGQGVRAVHGTPEVARAGQQDGQAEDLEQARRVVGDPEAVLLGEPAPAAGQAADQALLVLGTGHGGGRHAGDYPPHRRPRLPVSRAGRRCGREP